VAQAQDTASDEHRQLIHDKLGLAFSAEMAARREGRTARVPGLPRNIAADCEAIMSSNSDPLRLAALTLVAAKSAIPDLDVQQIQGGEVDYRSRAKDTVVPLVAKIADAQSVAYRPSADPFVSNPLREPRIDEAWLTGRRGAIRQVAERLLSLLAFVEGKGDAAPNVLAELVAAQLDRFEDERVVYPVPSRVTVAMVVRALEDFLLIVAGGSRLERVAVALLRFAGEHGAHWDRVIGHHGNDSARRDADCFKGAVLVALGESKDQVVTEAHVQQLADEMLETGAVRGFLLSREVHIASNRTALAVLVQKRHLLGQRIEVLDVIETARAWLVLADAGDEDLPRFLRIVCDELDDWADLVSRRDWADILARLG
jgi:hypothetical protein